MVKTFQYNYHTSRISRHDAMNLFTDKISFKLVYESINYSELNKVQ